MGGRSPGELVACGLAAPGLRPANPHRPDLFGDQRRMKALTLWQPWASLVARGVKVDETRHWATDYRGSLAIHASKRLDVAGSPDALCSAALGLAWRDSVPLGAVVAVAQLVDVVPAPSVYDHLTRANQAAGNFASSRYAWRLAEVRALRKPVPFAGRQGLFNWDAPEDLEGLLGPVLDHIALCHQIGWGFSR